MEPGSCIGGYEIQSRLGAGAMGEVYRARQLSLGRDVALKVTSGEHDPGADAARRFKREIDLHLTLSHPNLVSVLDAGEDAGRRYLVLELVEGETLEELLRSWAPFDVTSAAITLHALASGLEYLHGKGILHRDIKPGNVLVARTGAIKLADFGLARGDHHTMLTQASQRLGTPLYMSPEVLAAGEMTAAADLWALGVLAYRSLTSRFPIERDGFTATLQALLTEEVTPITAHRVRVPPELGRICMRLLSRRPADRPGAAEVAEAIASFLPPGVEASGLDRSRIRRRATRLPLVPTVPALAETVKRLPYGRGIGLAAALVLVAATAWLLGNRGDRGHTGIARQGSGMSDPAPVTQVTQGDPGEARMAPISLHDLFEDGARFMGEIGELPAELTPAERLPLIKVLSQAPQQMDRIAQVIEEQAARMTQQEWTDLLHLVLSLADTLMHRDALEPLEAPTPLDLPRAVRSQVRKAWAAMIRSFDSGGTPAYVKEFVPTLLAHQTPEKPGSYAYGLRHRDVAREAQAAALRLPVSGLEPCLALALRAMLHHHAHNHLRRVLSSLGRFMADSEDLRACGELEESILSNFPQLLHDCLPVELESRHGILILGAMDVALLRVEDGAVGPDARRMLDILGRGDAALRKSPFAADAAEYVRRAREHGKTLGR